GLLFGFLGWMVRVGGLWCFGWFGWFGAFCGCVGALGWCEFGSFAVGGVCLGSCWWVSWCLRLARRCLALLQ
ncbi:hypothetical protein RA276_28750, partial [Pseudomonas syringae pv. tagetis]|uniref:hypothetical protein n=1 Tax=Pseudomonas syringae group genomosp. 7 TaxID=251699 RepID=UPI00376F97A8